VRFIPNISLISGGAKTSKITGDFNLIDAIAIDDYSVFR